MQHSKNFEKVQNYYNKKLWSLKMVKNVVGKSTGITEEEFKEITGQDYNA